MAIHRIITDSWKEKADLLKVYSDRPCVCLGAVIHFVCTWLCALCAIGYGVKEVLVASWASEPVGGHFDVD